MRAARVRLIRVHVDVEFGCWVNEDMYVVEGHARRASDTQLHAVALRNSKVRGLGGVHMHVDRGANDAFLQFDYALGPNNDGSRSARNVAGEPNGNIREAQHDGICEGQLNLRLL